VCAEQTADGVEIVAVRLEVADVVAQVVAGLPVQHRHVVAARDQTLYEVAAHEPGAAYHEDAHVTPELRGGGGGAAVGGRQPYWVAA
jgi:hypothetical protein